MSQRADGSFVSFILIGIAAVTTIYWVSVFKKMLKKAVSLENIKKNKALKHLSLIKQSRLSVMPIDSKSWKILNKMSNINK